MKSRKFGAMPRLERLPLVAYVSFTPLAATAPDDTHLDKALLHGVWIRYTANRRSLTARDGTSTALRS